MASPTPAELETQWKNAVELVDNLLTAQTVVADLDAYQQSFESDFVAQQADSALSFRQAVSAALAQGEQVQEAILLAIAKHAANKPAGDAQGALDRIYDYFIENDKTLLKRGLAFGTITAAAGNVGNGTVRQLTTDAKTYPLEAVTVESKRFRCLQDQNTGAIRNQELFEVVGASAEGADELDRNRSGIVTQIAARTSLDSLLANPGFSQFSIAGTVSVGSPYTLQSGDSVTNWSITTLTAAQLTQATADQYRTNIGDASPTALRLLDDNTVTQLFSAANLRLNPQGCFDLLIPIKRESSADGTVTITLGSTSLAVSVSGLASGWNAVFLTLDAGLWAENITANGAAITIQWASRTTGTIVIDEITLVEFEEIDGVFYAIHAGTTPFLQDDEFTQAVTVASDSILQKWLWRSFGRYLPAVGTASQVTAAGGRTLTFANSGSTITASTGSFISDGYERGQTLVVAGTSDNNGSFIIVSVSATVIVADSAITDEGPLSSTATLNAGPSITDPA